MKNLFKKNSKAVTKNASQAENTSMNSMPSYMLPICGTNVGTIKKVDESLLGDKMTMSVGLMSTAFFEQMSDINENKSDQPNILGSSF